jgi:hypothetical protein
MKDVYGQPYYIIECGTDADCPASYYCDRQTRDPTSYYCKSRCGNGVCEAGEICPADGSGPEVCDGADNNCNGFIDDDLAITCSSDSDCPADGCYTGTYRNYGCTNPGTCSSRCAYTELITDADKDGFDTECDGDCNDFNQDTYPNAPEICDGLVNNCGGILPADESDMDGDGARICDGDCDDSDPSLSPYAEDICCDGIDNNCNGFADEDCCCIQPQEGCLGNMIYWFDSCGNPDEFIEDCGDTSYGSWGPNYCEGNNIAHNRTVSARGCANSECYDQASTETTVIEMCSYRCSGGSCISLPGDTNSDCIVNILDLASVGQAFGSEPGDPNWDPGCDMNSDNRVGILDLASVGISYGSACGSGP